MPTKGMSISITKRFFQGNINLIPNGCFDAYDVKVNKDIFKYQEKVKLISQFQRFFLFFNGLLEIASVSEVDRFLYSDTECTDLNSWTMEF